MHAHYTATFFYLPYIIRSQDRPKCIVTVHSRSSVGNRTLSYFHIRARYSTTVRLLTLENNYLAMSLSVLVDIQPAVAAVAAAAAVVVVVVVVVVVAAAAVVAAVVMEVVLKEVVLRAVGIGVVAVVETIVEK